MSWSRRSASTRTVRGGLRGCRVLAGRCSCGSRFAGGRRLDGRDWRRLTVARVLTHDHRLHIADVARHLRDRLFVVLGGKPDLDLAAGKLLHALLGGDAADQLTAISECGEHHVRADRGHHHPGVEHDGDMQDAVTVITGGLKRGDVGNLGAAGMCQRLLRSAIVDKLMQRRDQRRRVELLLTIGLDRIDRVRERIEACQDRVDRVWPRAGRVRWRSSSNTSSI